MYTGKPMPVKTENNPTACFAGRGLGSIVWNIKAHKLIKVICEQPLIITNIETLWNILCSIIWPRVIGSCRGRTRSLKDEILHKIKKWILTRIKNMYKTKSVNKANKSKINFTPWSQKLHHMKITEIKWNLLCLGYYFLQTGPGFPWKSNFP